MHIDPYITLHLQVITIMINTHVYSAKSLTDCYENDINILNYVIYFSVGEDPLQMEKFVLNKHGFSGD